MVLKRVVYGVDKNPMAVELAKVALWLHSFTVGAPLSFLDHHLRAGDSVIGAWVGPTVDALRDRGALFNLGQIARVEQVAGLMAEIEETTDNDIAEVASSKEKFRTVAEATEPVGGLFSLIAAELMGVLDAAPKIAPDRASSPASPRSSRRRRGRPRRVRAGGRPATGAGRHVRRPDPHRHGRRAHSHAGAEAAAFAAAAGRRTSRAVSGDQHR